MIDNYHRVLSQYSTKKYKLSPSGLDYPQVGQASLILVCFRLVQAYNKSIAAFNSTIISINR